MERYDYYEAVKEDLKQYIMGGSYTFNTWEAEENLCHNMDLLEEAANEFGDGLELLGRGAEVCDVTIRCYVLGQVIDEALDELKEELPEEEEEEEGEE